MKLSGFTFIHDAITGGYPIVEAIESVRHYVDEIVAVDMESTDSTAELLARLGVRVLSSPWQVDQPLKTAFRLHTECTGEVIIFFEADEVFDLDLLYRIRELVQTGQTDLAVYRLQLEQNFQRCRWYPTPVHRVFPKGGGSYLEHPTNCPPGITVIGPEHGYLWDITNCFRDNIEGRRQGHFRVWGPPRRLFTPEHFTQPVELSLEEEQARLNDPLWTWPVTPFNIPEILRPLVGKTRYEPGL